MTFSSSTSSVSCGTHNASSCAECPQVSPLRSARLMFLFLMKMCSEFHVCRFSYFQGHGESWCNGECRWRGGACVANPTLGQGSSISSVRCGNHNAFSCSECPQARTFVSQYTLKLTFIQGQGKNWCNGECRWTAGICVKI